MTQLDRVAARFYRDQSDIMYAQVAWHDIRKTITVEATAMQNFQSILFATDFRPASAEAVGATARLATATGAQVSVLHVLEPASTGIAAHFYHQQVGEVLLQKLAQDFASNDLIVKESLIRTGPFAETIIQAARDASLVVIGAGEQNKQGQFALGPIAEAVVAHASRPVLAVRPGDPKLQFQRILCAVDHSESSAEAIRHSIRLAKLFGGQLTILSVVPEVSWLVAAVETGGLVDVARNHANHWTSEFDQLLDRFDFAGISWKKEVSSGVPHEVILATAGSQDADLLVLGTTGRSAVKRILLGSTTRRILRRLPCSLLTVHGESSA